MKTWKFEAEIHAADGGGAYVLFPYDVEKEFGTKGRIPVHASFNGVSYQGSLIKYGHPRHMLGMPKAIREQTGTAPGDTVSIELWRDDQPRTLEVPKELEQAMRRAGVLADFNALSYTHRKEYCRWISDAKKEETRQNRLTKAVQMLQDGVKTPDSSGRK